MPLLTNMISIKKIFYLDMGALLFLFKLNNKIISLYLEGKAHIWEWVLILIYFKKLLFPILINVKLNIILVYKKISVLKTSLDHSYILLQYPSQILNLFAFLEEN